MTAVSSQTWCDLFLDVLLGLPRVLALQLVLRRRGGRMTTRRQRPVQTFYQEMLFSIFILNGLTWMMMQCAKVRWGALVVFEVLGVLWAAFADQRLDAAHLGLVSREKKRHNRREKIVKTVLGCWRGRQWSGFETWGWHRRAAGWSVGLENRKRKTGKQTKAGHLKM